MSGEERRGKIIQALKNSDKAVSATTLAKEFDVSRQVIVQDVALLRAVDKNILATTRGYILYRQETRKAERSFLVKHTTEEIEDELCTIVDNGGKVRDVIVMHEIYGEISAALMISTRQDVYNFVGKVKAKKTVPLKELTAGVHLHTVEADSEEILDRIEAALREKKYLHNS